jgi:hypothetical protein
MMQTIPHIIRMCNYPFSQRVLAVDTSPLSGAYTSRPCIGTFTQLQECCDKLLSCGLIDKIIDVDFSKKYHEKVYGKHLGKFIRQTHNFRGAPVLGYMFLLEEAKSDYLLHFNTDILIYQDPGYNWVEEGIRKLCEYPEIACVTPLSGPPTKDGSLHQQVAYDRDSRGFYRLKEFTSRKFLVDIKRFGKLLPLQILWKSKSHCSNSTQRMIEDSLSEEKELDRWETMVSARLRETPYYRIDLDTCSAWAVHSSQNHDQVFLKNLPRIIEKIESGWYPPGQEGHYNLLSELWL